MKTNLQAALLALSLDRSSTAPLHAQLTEALRALILDGTARPGERLPASRDLAAELSVSRQTALTALDQLIAEGYLAARRGAGTFVIRDSSPVNPQSPQLTCRYKKTLRDLHLAGLVCLAGAANQPPNRYLIVAI